MSIPSLAEGGITVLDIMRHSLVQPFKQTSVGTGKINNPSYLPGVIFAKVLLDVVATKENTKWTYLSAGALIGRLETLAATPSLSSSLRALARAANGDTGDLLVGIGTWYDAQMDRVSGAYKRWAKKAGIVVAVLVVGVLHVDAFSIASALWVDGTLRASVVASTDVVKKCQDASSPGMTTGTQSPAECAVAELDLWRLGGMPIGWQEWGRAPKSPSGWINLFLGLGLSIGATGMGAPFWFAAMNKLINVRNSGNPPAKDPR
jgi:hypothetical protein